MDAAGVFTIEARCNNTVGQRSVRIDSGECLITHVLSKCWDVVVPTSQHELRHVFSLPRGNGGTVGDKHWRI